MQRKYSVIVGTVSLYIWPTSPRVSPNINYGLRVLRRCPRFTDYNKRALEWRSLISGETVHVSRVTVGSLWGISEPSAQFCCKPKTALKKIRSFFFLRSLTTNKKEQMK